MFVRPDASLETRCSVGLRPPDRRHRVVDLEREGTYRGAVNEQIGMGKRVHVLVQHDADVALTEKHNVLGLVLADRPEPRMLEHCLECRFGALIDREFDEPYAFELRRRRRIEQLDPSAHLSGGAQRDAGIGFRQPPDLFLGEQQGSPSVLRRSPGWRGAKVVIENFERNCARVTSGENALQEQRNIEGTLAGEAAEVPAQRQRVHAKARRVRKLYEEDPLAGKLRETRPVVRQRERMKAVNDQSKVRMLSLLDYAPCFVEGPNMRSPRQGFVADFEISAGGALSQFMKLCRRAGLIVDDIGPNIRAHYHERGAELFHNVEFSFRPVEIACQLHVRDPLEVTKWLKQIDGQTNLAGVEPNVSWRPIKEQEVIFKDLDAVEMSRDNRVEFLRQRAA